MAISAINKHIMITIRIILAGSFRNFLRLHSSWDIQGEYRVFQFHIIGANLYVIAVDNKTIIVRVTRV